MVKPGEPLVELRHVSMTYGHGEHAVKAVDNLSLTIKKGEFIAVVGPSGCGKSSLMKLISGLKPTSEGTLTIEGQPVKGPINKVGMAFQASNLLPWRTAVDNVLLPLKSCNRTVHASARKKPRIAPGRARCSNLLG